MSLTNCRECGKEISDEAKTCPICGARLKKSNWLVWVLATPFIVLALMFLIGAILPKSHLDEQDKRAAKRLAYDLCVKNVMNGTASMYECDKLRN